MFALLRERKRERERGKKRFSAGNFLFEKKSKFTISSISTGFLTSSPEGDQDHPTPAAVEAGPRAPRLAHDLAVRRGAQHANRARAEPCHKKVDLPGVSTPTY